VRSLNKQAGPVRAKSAKETLLNNRTKGAILWMTPFVFVPSIAMLI